ncbi:MAG: HAMP domain-containing protein [Deltaproteobacteria bacterium]|nr:HAMP domain-containing protein [Deltaproteobacteria bacterium]
MKLRTKLIFLQVGTLVFAIAIFATVAMLFQTTLTLLDQGIEAKARSCLRTLLATADVPIAAEDPGSVRRALRVCGEGNQDDPDLGFIVAYGRNGDPLAWHGKLPKGGIPPVPDSKTSIVRHGNAVRGSGPVMIEGQQFGTLSLEFQGHRIDSWRTRFMIAAGMLLLLVLLASAASIAFALHIIAPLRKMIRFASTVAEGDLHSQVDVRASDELAQLAQGLNHMVGQIRQLQGQLVDASRSAGMAEVATGVLHNVGNVLNSIKTSAGVIHKQLRDSRLATLEKVNALLEAQQTDLGGFFAKDQRAKRLPKLLSVLSAQLLKEHAYLREESVRLQRQVDHAAVIVKAQQRLARPAPLSETLNLSSLLDAALDAEGPWEDLHDIKIRRSYEDAPSLVLDRHKLVAIIVNLLRNAREALTDQEEKEIHLAILPAQASIAITITDNGCGMSEETRMHIFEHGFTTKASGHGFGLHACANAVRELGGALSATSEGPGLGATFTLRLPLAQRRRRVTRSDLGCEIPSKETSDV